MNKQKVFIVMLLFLFNAMLQAPSALDSLAFGFKDIYEKRDCANSKKIALQGPGVIGVLQQKSAVQCGFHALKNAVIFLENPNSVYDNQTLYTNENTYLQYYNQWKSYANKEGSIDQSIDRCISERLSNKKDQIVVMSNIALNDDEVSVTSVIEMDESVKLYKLLEKMVSDNPQNFVILLGVSEDYVSGHWRAVLVDAVNHRFFIADSFVGDRTSLTAGNRVLGNYIKTNILENGPCKYLHYYFEQNLHYMKDSNTLDSLNRKSARIDKFLLEKLKSSSPQFYAYFQNTFKELQAKFA